MPVAFVNGLDVYYETTGSGPPIVFLHGAGGNHLSWFQQVSYFAGRFTAITYDQRNWGWTREAEPGPGGSAYVQDLLALLDRLGIGAAHLVAHSMGGWTALGLAFRHPERVLSLVLSGTHGGIESPEIRAAIRLARRPQEHPQGPFVVSSTLSGRFAQAHPDKAFLYNGISAMNPPRAIPSMSDHLRAINSLSVADAASLRVPVQFIVGEEAAVVPPAAIELARRIIPGARIARVPATGNSVYFEQPELFNHVVDGFLARVGA